MVRQGKLLCDGDELVASLQEACGKVLAESVVAKVNVPEKLPDDAVSISTVKSTESPGWTSWFVVKLAVSAQNRQAPESAEVPEHRNHYLQQ